MTRLHVVSIAMLLGLTAAATASRADEVIGRAVSVQSVPAAPAPAPAEALSRPITLHQLPAMSPQPIASATGRPASVQWLPATSPPPMGPLIARSFTIETPGIALDVPDVPPGGELATSVGPATPSPFRGAMHIRYALSGPASVRLRIFDLLGRVVRDFGEGMQAPGTHVFDWSGTTDAGVRLAPGLYLCRLEVGGASVTRRAVLLE